MRVYGVIIINSEGWFTGGESKLIMQNNRDAAMEVAYNHYKRTFGEVKDDLDDKDEKPVTYDEFYNTMIVLLPEVIQCNDYHIQYEYFEKEVSEVEEDD